MGGVQNKNVIFDVSDNEKKAIEYAQKALVGQNNINYIHENAFKIKKSRSDKHLVNRTYDFIYSTGLFDYFDRKISVKLISNLRGLLKPGGKLVIATVRDKYSNPSVHFMEWVGDWSLVYRSDEEFKEFFLEAGFRENNLLFQYEQQGIMVYAIADNGNQR
jgi:SAM-dependent methyltransferase